MAQTPEQLDQPMNEAERPRGFGDTPDPVAAVDEDGDEMASPEEQADFDLMSVRGRKMVFGEGSEEILKMLSTSPDPAQGLGKATSMIVKSLVDSAKNSGRAIDSEVAINAGAEIIQDVAELAKAKGVYQYDDETEEEDAIASGMMWGVKFYGDGAIAAGELTPEWQAAAQQQVDEGLAEEGSPETARKTPIAEGVSQAVNGQAQPGQPGPGAAPVAAPAGVVGGQMQGGM
jgi:hypothetical protein